DSSLSLDSHFRGNDDAAIKTATPASAGVADVTIVRSLVFAVDFPYRLLHQPLHHRVEGQAALLRLGHAHHRARLGADLHLLLGVALRELLGGLGVDDLVAHADHPHAGGFAAL